MNAVSSFGFNRPSWQNIVILTLGFWLSASLLLDWVIMPSLYVSGMMTQPSFASTGYVLFWNFNRIELLSAGLVLTGVLAASKKHSQWLGSDIFLSVLLLAVVLVDTYGLAPEMSALGMNLNLFQSATKVSGQMDMFHCSYWILESIKLFASSFLLWRYSRRQIQTS
ncbi:membrane protein [Calothrix sp. 336/3]|uniref:membrane protein n=1 Tax=Calothrix sp. 336/3 TaxID=1337936 RepID=UPI0004E3DEE3|nr:membrane protein [Calothrix sp. 336/3]AKG24166.1 membrane protein [Calothrix sp. 336/3]